MTDLPTEENKTEAQWRHNWLYSVLPITLMYEFSGSGVQLRKRPRDKFILSGYCRTCDNAFSVEVPIAYPAHPDLPYPVRVTKMGIPKFGCIDPNSPEAVLG